MLLTHNGLIDTLRAAKRRARRKLSIASPQNHAERRSCGCTVQLAYDNIPCDERSEHRLKSVEGDGWLRLERNRCRLEIECLRRAMQDQFDRTGVVRVPTLSIARLSCCRPCRRCRRTAWRAPGSNPMPLKSRTGGGGPPPASCCAAVLLFRRAACPHHIARWRWPPHSPGPAARRHHGTRRGWRLAS
jgi:hypothetical protein